MFDETDWTRLKELKDVQEKKKFLPVDMWTSSQEVRSILSSKRNRKKKSVLTGSVIKQKRKWT